MPLSEPSFCFFCVFSSRAPSLLPSPGTLWCFRQHLSTDGLRARCHRAFDSPASRGLPCFLLSAGRGVTFRLLMGPLGRVRGIVFLDSTACPAPYDASILTWPTLPTLPLLSSRALRRPWRQLFIWVWVSFSPAFLRFFFSLVSRRPLSRAPAPFRCFRLPQRHFHASSTTTIRLADLRTFYWDSA